MNKNIEEMAEMVLVDSMALDKILDIIRALGAEYCGGCPLFRKYDKCGPNIGSCSKSLKTYLMEKQHDC